MQGVAEEPGRVHSLLKPATLPWLKPLLGRRERLTFAGMSPLPEKWDRARSFSGPEAKWLRKLLSIKLNFLMLQNQGGNTAVPLSKEGPLPF